ncbi:MAG TPA: zinc-ribbon domain-containing protein [Anaerolineaceae bacterium]|nr:zinc-ribbon domain-containing protein [Anaerolineaceae bacterium]
MSVTCPNCGKTVRTGAKFCSHCGKEMPATVPLSQETSLPPEPAPVPETEPGAPEASPAEPQPAEPQPAVPATEICLHCGKTIRQGIKFCNYCGKPTAAAGEVPAAQAIRQSVPPPAAIPPMQPPAGAEAPKKKGRKKGCLILLIVLLAAVILLAAAAFLVLRGTFGDLQLPAPVEEFASRLGKATPTSEPSPA